MTKYLKIATIILALCLSSCGKINNSKQKNDYDSSIIAVLPFNAAQDWISKEKKTTNLTTEDFLNIETILNKCFNEYNTEKKRQFEEINNKHPEYKLDKNDFIIDLKRYKRQYLATINSKGEKEVWINCFCNTDNFNWRTEIIIVEDGGNCYFNVKINLTTGHFYDLKVNGNA